MNRRERKAMEKRLGLDKYKKSLPRAERFEMNRQNIIAGRKMEEEMKEIRRVQENGAEDKKASERISSIATDLMFNKKMDWVSAQAEALEVYKREVESLSNKE
jgi:hypothetical protein